MLLPVQAASSRSGHESARIFRVGNICKNHSISKNIKRCTDMALNSDHFASKRGSGTQRSTEMTASAKNTGQK